MSQDNENKPEENDFAFNFDENHHSENDGMNSFANEEFNPFADETFSPDSNANETEGISFPESVPEENTGPSEFLMGTPEEPESAAPEIVAEEPAGGKKAKKAKKEKPVKQKKEKKPKEKKAKQSGGGIGVGGALSLLLGLLLLGLLIAFNIFTILDPPKDVGFTSTIYYLIGVDIFGLFSVAVPFMFFANREKKGIEVPPEQKLDLFKLVLGTSVIAMSLGVILLMTTLYRYDFETKPTQSLPSLSMPSPESKPAQ